MLTTLVPLLTALTLFVTPSEPPPGEGQGRPPRPPREAIEACEGADEGEACAFLGRDGDTVEGSCWRPDADKPLACRPSSPWR